MHFYECAAPTGSGKSYAAVSASCDAVRHNIKSAIVQPTIRLLKQTYNDAMLRFPAVKGRIRLIASDRNSDTVFLPASRTTSMAVIRWATCYS